MRCLPALRQEGFCLRFFRDGYASDFMPEFSPSFARPLGTMVAYGFERGLVKTDLEVAARLGADHLEILPDWRAIPDPIEMAKIAKDRGFTIWSAHGSWGGQAIKASRVDLGSLEPSIWSESLDDLRRCLDWLRDANGTCLVIHPGGLSNPEDRQARRDSLMRGLDSLADHILGTRLRLCVENLPPGVHPGSRMEELAALVVELNRPEVGLALDTGHANLGPGISTEILAAQGQLLTTHVHDNNGRSDSHLPPGEGTLDWTVCSESLDAIDYRGPVMLECIRELRKRPESINDAFLELIAKLCRFGVA